MARQEGSLSDPWGLKRVSKGVPNTLGHSASWDTLSDTPSFGDGTLRVRSTKETPVAGQGCFKHKSESVKGAERVQFRENVVEKGVSESSFGLGRRTVLESSRAPCYQRDLLIFC